MGVPRNFWGRKIRTATGWESGSGREWLQSVQRAVAFSGRRRCAARTAVLFVREGCGGCAAVLKRQRGGKGESPRQWWACQGVVVATAGWESGSWHDAALSGWWLEVQRAGHKDPPETFGHRQWRDTCGQRLVL